MIDARIAFISAVAREALRPFAAAPSTIPDDTVVTIDATGLGANITVSGIDLRRAREAYALLDLYPERCRIEIVCNICESPWSDDHRCDPAALARARLG